MAKTQKIKNKKKPNFRAIATTILLLAIVLFSYSACRFLDEVKLIKEYNERAIKESNNATFSAISGLINSICISAEDSLQDNLKIAGSTLSKDDIDIVLQTLNGDDNTALESKKISNIFFKGYYFTHIKNGNNDIFICNEDGIIADYSQNDESDIYKFVERFDKRVEVWIRARLLRIGCWWCNEDLWVIDGAKDGFVSIIYGWEYIEIG